LPSAFSIASALPKSTCLDGKISNNKIKVLFIQWGQESEIRTNLLTGWSSCCPLSAPQLNAQNIVTLSKYRFDDLFIFLEFITWSQIESSRIVFFFVFLSRLGRLRWPLAFTLNPVWWPEPLDGLVSLMQIGKLSELNTIGLWKINKKHFYNKLI
jgi:hypothetical protein